MRRPRALTKLERDALERYLSGRYSATWLKAILFDWDLYRFRKYNNYLRWRKRELRKRGA